jgi:RimJ/RimL family protein N-acetyltransferase
MRNIELRPLNIFRDLDNIMLWVNDPEITFYFARMGHITRKEEEKFLTSILASRNDIVYSIFVDNTYAGQCSINQIDWTAEIGRMFLVLTKEFQGQSLASPVIQELINKAFSEHSLFKIWLIVREENTKSQSIYMRSGFKFEALLRKEYKVNGIRYDMVRMCTFKRTEE